VNDAAGLEYVGARFQIEGRFVEGRRYGNGHINATYLATYDGPRGPIQYIHQRINDRVFPDVPALMHNIGIVCRHVRAKLEADHIEGIDRRVLTLIRPLVPTQDGGDVLQAGDGSWWRTYDFIDGSTAHEYVESPQQAHTVAKAFGGFLRAVRDLDPSTLHETLPGFHDTYRRFETLITAISSDPANRAIEASPEITFCLQNARLAHQLEQLREGGSVRNCVTHNDTKINNVLIDDRTGEGICVIDLDTVMPGLALYDFGDIVRTATAPAAEDEPDLSRIEVSLPMFEAVARGFITMAGEALLEAEIDHLVTAGKVITFESGIRFLADYLLGDVYFRTNAPDQNLRRARTQFALVESLERNEEQLHQIVRRIVRAYE
jgi:hypothetical protein